MAQQGLAPTSRGWRASQWPRNHPPTLGPLGLPFHRFNPPPGAPGSRPPPSVQGQVEEAPPGGPAVDSGSVVPAEVGGRDGQPGAEAEGADGGEGAAPAAAAAAPAHLLHLLRPVRVPAAVGRRPAPPGGGTPPMASHWPPVRGPQA
nr:proline-rich protein 2-like [Vulpes vulpes]